MRLSIHDYLSYQPYIPVQETMRHFALSRTENDTDQCWLMEHQPVFTLGQAADPAHVLMPGDIPVVSSDRGGQVTFHGPGLLMIYTLFDLNRHALGVRDYVRALEQLIIQYCASKGISASVLEGAPGVYVNGQKIASIGLRVRKGMSYHGTCLNVDGDLSPFQRINPCGYEGLSMTRLSDWTDISISQAKAELSHAMMQHFGFTEHSLERMSA